MVSVLLKPLVGGLGQLEPFRRKVDLLLGDVQRIQTLPFPVHCFCI